MINDGDYMTDEKTQQPLGVASDLNAELGCLQCYKNGACPFAFNDTSEYVQNLGCLPTPYEIIQMRQKHGKTWACHDNPKKPCLGALEYMKKNRFEYKVIDKDLLTENSNWHLYCH